MLYCADETAYATGTPFAPKFGGHEQVIGQT
jgi:hypothetical protein